MGNKDLYTVAMTAVAGAEAIGILGILIGGAAGILAIKNIKN